MPKWSLETLADLMTRLRTAQRKYFRTRAQGDLEASKVLEREVDTALREIASRQSQPLFARETDGPELR